MHAAVNRKHPLFICIKHVLVYVCLHRLKIYEYTYNGLNFFNLFFLTVGHFANPPSQVSPQSQLSAPPSSRARTDRSCISLSSNSSDVSEAAGNLPMSPSSFVIKEEPCDIAPVLIKLEMSEESFGELHESAGHPYQDHQSPSVNGDAPYLLSSLLHVHIPKHQSHHCFSGCHWTND